LIYKYEFSNEARKFLKRLEKPTTIRIIQAIESIRTSPDNHPNVKKLKGYEGDIYCLRVGGFRILYEIINDKLIIFVFRIGSRGDVYKQL
jgi:mRNA interferase RelE/StbE